MKAQKHPKSQIIIWIAAMVLTVLWNYQSAYAQQVEGTSTAAWLHLYTTLGNIPTPGDNSEPEPYLVAAPNDAPTILEHPQDATVMPGGMATFTITAEGTAPLNYQWQRDGVDIPGATLTILKWANLQLSEDGMEIRCVVSNAEGITTSNIATVHVLNPDGSPYIIDEPEDATGIVGGAASFSVKAGGAEPLTYQWQRGGIDISGANGATYQLDDLTLNDDGALFRAVVSNASGDATSDAATLMVQSEEAPKVTVIQGEYGQVAVDPDKAVYAYGETVTFTATPDAEYTLESWGGNQTGNTNPLVITLEGDVTVAPTFKLNNNVNVIPVSDDFNVCTLNTALWTFDNRGDNLSTYKIVDDEKLEIFIPGGTAHDLWSNADDAPRMMQPAEDSDLDLVAKFDSPVNQRFQIQGLLVEGANGTKVRADFRWDGSTVRVFAASFVDNGSGPSATPQLDVVIAPPADSSLYVRLVRMNDDWTLHHSFEGGSWISDGIFFFEMNVEKVGIFAGNAEGNPEHTAVVDYFFNMVAPISPEDGKSRDLPINVIGQGQATKNPEKSAYACDEPIELTATPNTGGQFLGWNGAASGTDSPVTINYNIGDAVTATFTQFASYTLTVTSEGEGSVSIDPDQATYPEGTPVTLTATSNAGWAFKEWQGDVPAGSTDAILSLTMNSNKTVKVLFEQVYSLNITTEGQGSVSKEPDQATYPVGAQVTMTAEAESGWAFKEWQGDVPDGNTDRALVLTMNSDKTVKAIFEEATTFSLTVTTLGEGTVSKSPDQVAYPVSVTVTLTATANTGWVFDQWKGDVPDDSVNPTLVLTMDRDKAVKAVFLQAITRSYVPWVRHKEE